jgi:type I restriction enzyme, S subunit
MILQKYESYKDSGVEWLGEIPEGWEVKRLKDISKNMISGPFGSNLKKEIYVSEGYKIYGQEQVIKDDFEFGDYYIIEEKFLQMKNYEVFENDILISCVGTFGKIALVPKNAKKGIINPRLIKLSPILRKVHPQFLDKILKSFFSFSQFEHRSRGGTMDIINLNILKSLNYPFPRKIVEQINITNFLDKKTSQIDSKINLLQEKISSYEELKKSVINETVCRGLNKNVELKDSEIEWIGNIPKHWNLNRGKNIFFELGKSKISASEGEDKGEYKFFTSSVNQSKWLNTYTEIDEEIIFSTGGLAGVHYCDKEFSYSTDCWAIKSSKVFLKYYFYYFKSIIYEIDTIAFRGAGLRHLQRDFIIQNSLPNPPKEEQIQIAKYLDEKTTKIDNIISKIKNQINTLKEFRKTLINDVVTGKVRVS